MLSALYRWRSQLFYGWYMAAAGMVIYGLGITFHGYALSVFFLPMSRDLGLSRAAFSLVISLSRAEGAFEGPIAGWLIDRLGPRPLILVGSALMGIGFILLSQVHSFLGFLLVFMGVITVGSGAGSFAPVVAAMNTWFVRYRATAMALVMSSSAIGTAVIIPLLSMLIFRLGWRPAAVIIGLVILAACLPLGLVFRRSPESMGLRSDGDRGGQAAQPLRHGAMVTSVDFTVKEALKTAAFWMLMAATGLRTAIFGAIMLHFIPIMVWKGVEEQYAAFLMGIIFLMAFASRLFLGWLGDRWWSKAKLISLALALGVVGFFLLLYGQARWQFWLFIILIAVVEGVPPLNWAIVGDFFGRRHYATLRGVLNFFTAWGSMFFPVFAGLVWDRTQSYELVLVSFPAFFALSAVLFFLLRPSRRAEGA